HVPPELVGAEPVALSEALEDVRGLLERVVRCKPRARDRPERPEQHHRRADDERLRPDELAESLAPRELRFAERRRDDRSRDGAHSAPPKRMRGLRSE